MGKLIIVENDRDAGLISITWLSSQLLHHLSPSYSGIGDDEYSGKMVRIN